MERQRRYDQIHGEVDTCRGDYHQAENFIRNRENLLSTRLARPHHSLRKMFDAETLASQTRLG